MNLRFDTTEKEFINDIARLAVEAGELIMGLYRSGDLDIRLKTDLSPVTAADRAAHEHIAAGLAAYGFPVLSEEGRDIPFAERKAWKEFWLVDPLDGTKEFISGNGEFTVNIALVRGGEAVKGVIYSPVDRVVYFATGPRRAFRAVVPAGTNGSDLSGKLENISHLPATQADDGLTIVVSRSHFNGETNRMVERLRAHNRHLEVVHRGSSLKFCTLAEGRAQLYARLSRTMEWDTAAGQAIAEGAGCVVMDRDRMEPLRYNKPDLENPSILAARDMNLLSQMLV